VEPISPGEATAFRPDSSPAFLEAVLDLASDAVITVDEAGQIIHVNRALNEMFRYQPGELIGRPLDVLIPVPSRVPHRRFVESFMASGAAETRMQARPEIVGLRSDGTRFPAEASIARIESRGNTVFTAVIRDLSALREAEQARDRQEILFRYVLDGSPDLISLLDASGRILNANSAHEAVLGSHLADIVGASALSFVHPEDREFAARWFLERSSSSFDHHQVLRIVSASGAVRWFEVHVTPLPAAVAGEQAVLLVSHDVSDRVEAEAYLLEREELFRATFEQAAVGMAHVSLDGSWMRVNSRLCEITGYTRAEILQMGFNGLTHPEDLEAETRALAEFMSGGRETYRAEKRWLRKDGAVVWVLTTVSLRRSGEGEPLHFVVVVEDVSERKASEAAALELRAGMRTSLVLLQTVLDTLSEHIVVIDAKGKIVHVNRAWKDFALHAAQQWAPAAVGGNYLDRCDEDVRAALGEVLSGSRAELRREVPIHTVQGKRWFVMKAALTRGLGEPLCVISHEDVTELKLAYDELERSAAALAVSLSAVAITDVAGRLTYVNRAFARMWELGAEQSALGRPIEEFWAEPERIRAVVRSLGARDRTWSGELQAVRRGGTRFAVQISASQVTDDAGEPMGVMLSCIDVSDRTLAEDELRRSQESLNRAQEVAGVGNWDWDIQTNALWWSDQIYRIFGLEPQEFAATYPAFLERVHPDDRALVEEAVARALAGERYSIDHRLVRADDGSIRTVHELGEVVFSEDGQPLHMIGTVQDVTEARAMQSQLRQQRDLLAAVVGAAPVIIFATDRDGVFTLADGQALASLGLRPGELVGKPVFENAGDLAGLADAVRRALAGESVSLHVGNGTLAFDAFCAPLAGADGTVEGVVGVAVDITERERLREQLGQAQKMEAVGRLAGGIAHDFNNLLTVILTYSSLVKDALAPGSPAREDIEEVTKAGQRASQLTQQLLAFARKQVVQVQEIDLNRALIGVNRMLRPLVGSDVRFEVLLDEAAGQIVMDPVQFEQVVLNLVVNARDAVPPGGSITVRSLSMDLLAPGAALARGVAPGRYSGIQVADTGVGMDEKTLQRIFEPFFTTKGVGKGTGLGLATCYGIAQQASGAIWAESAPGEGTTFTFIVPAASQTRTEATSVEYAAATPINGSALMVEDEPQLLAMARRVLESAGMRVIAASDGHEALRAAGEALESIDILVTDVVMPHMSGVELARELTARRPGLRVLYVSGYAKELPLPGTESTPAVSFIAKPFTPAQLLDAVRRLLSPETSNA
jgi:PAS domain S-box-containing protein